MTDEPRIAWLVTVCEDCGWRGLPSRTAEQLAELPVDCPNCGHGVGAVVYRGTWREFTRARIAALRAQV